jgi:hypothetical protein
MQPSPDADTVGFATLTGHLIDIALDQRGPPEGNFQRTLQVLKKAPQVLTQATKIGKIFSLHPIKLNNIQINRCQEKNRKPYIKMFLMTDGSLTLMGFGKKLFYCLNCRNKRFLCPPSLLNFHSIYEPKEARRCPAKRGIWLERQRIALRR